MNGVDFVAFCRSHKGQTLIKEVQDLLERQGGDLPSVVLALKKGRLDDPALLSKVAELCLARRKAGPLVPWANEGFFTLQALEQSTAPQVAHYHAQSFSGAATLLEVGGGIGFDTIALARIAGSVTVLEPDLERAPLLRANMELVGAANVTVHAQSIEEFCLHNSMSGFEALWADPSRREGEVRIKDPARYRPSLVWLLRQALPERVGIKIAPGARLDFEPEIEALSREWIGMRDECREQILWRGVNKDARSVTLVDKQQTFSPLEYPSEVGVVDLSLELPRHLFEPHAAVIAAGCVAQLFNQHGIKAIDRRIAYGVSEHRPAESAWVKALRILEHFPYSRRRLDHAVQAQGFSRQSTVKKRGLAQSAEELHAHIAWAHKGEIAGVVVMARVGNGQHAFLCEWC